MSTYTNHYHQKAMKLGKKQDTLVWADLVRGLPIISFHPPVGGQYSWAALRLTQASRDLLLTQKILYATPGFSL